METWKLIMDGKDSDMKDVLKRKEESTPEAGSFEQYLSSTRNKFVNAVRNQEWNTELRVEAEDMLIAFDQLRERYIEELKRKRKLYY